MTAKAGILAAEERRPLLGFTKLDTFDLTDLRERAAKLNPLTDYTYVEYENMPGYVVVRHVAGAIAQVTVVLGAYFFLQSTGDNIMPHCALWKKPFSPKYGIERWEEHFCYFSSGCFWTFPIICPLAIVLLFWKNLLDKRLFYECLFNRILLVEQSSSYLVSPTFWFLFVYFLGGISCIFFIRYGTDRPYDELIFSMLAYISPTVGFVMVLLSHWSVNRLIVSLPLYVERDCPAAMDLLKECKFMSYDDFWKAFCVAEEMLAEAMREQRTQFTLSTGEMMRLILDLHGTGRRTPARRGGYDCWESAWDYLCSRLSTAHERYIRGYWVSRFLFSPLFQDVRARRFRLWARVYYAFMCVSTLVFAYAMVYTINELFHYYHTVPLYVHMPAPHDVPSELRNATEHVPEVVGKVQDELNRGQVALVGVAQRAFTGLVGNATKHVPQMVGTVENAWRDLNHTQLSFVGVVTGAVGNATGQVPKMLASGFNRTQQGLDKVERELAAIGITMKDFPNVVPKVEEEFHDIHQQQLAFARVVQREFGIVGSATKEVPQVVGKAKAEVRGTSDYANPS